MNQSHAAPHTRFFAAALALACGGAMAQPDGLLRLKAGEVEVRTLPDAKPLNQARPVRIDREMVLVLGATITPDQRAQIESTGAVLGDYLPDHAYVVDLGRARIDALRALGFVTHIVDYDDAWKIDPDLATRPFQTDARKALSAAGVIQARIYLFPGAQIKDALARVGTQAGVTLVRSELEGDRFMIEARGSAAAIRALAKIGAVEWIEPAPEITLRNSSDRWIVQSNVNNSFPVYDAGIHGENQLIAVMDGKVDVNHCSFLDPEGDPFGDDHRKIQAYNTSATDFDFHGTHVAATALGDNNADNDTRGVAYKARLIFNTVPAYAYSTIISRLTEHYAQGAAIHTNSWGDDGTTDYTGLARGIDAFSHDNDDNLVIFAVTNLNSLKTPENAKNCLAVGASQDFNNQGSFCSGGIGPTDDGRRKPEIFAPGCDTNSARALTSCGTIGFTGTSMAAPAIAGAAALTRQYFQDGYYPTGLPESDDGFIPSGALLKATLLNSAVNMTGIAGYPSDREGWGRVLLDNALSFDGDAGSLIVRDVRNASGEAMETGDDYELNFTVGSVSQPLKATLVWHDAPASPGSFFTPVNNLDLQVVLPTGDVLLGNNITNGISGFGGTADELNNVEMVMLPAAVTGQYTLRVLGTAVNQGPQGYAIVITGAVSEASSICAADLTGDGVLNFFDISAFLSAFSAQGPAADFNGDGAFNFFDVSAFLSAFNAGCP